MHKYGGKAYYTKYVEHLRKCHGINCFVKKVESRWQQFAKNWRGGCSKASIKWKSIQTLYNFCVLYRL